MGSSRAPESRSTHVHDPSEDTGRYRRTLAPWRQERDRRLSFLKTWPWKPSPYTKLTRSGRPIWMRTAEQHFPQITEEHPDRSLEKSPWRGPTKKRRWGGQTFCSLSCHSRSTAKAPRRRHRRHMSLTRLTSRKNSCKYPTQKHVQKIQQDLEKEKTQVLKNRKDLHLLSHQEKGNRCHNEIPP